MKAGEKIHLCFQVFLLVILELICTTCTTNTKQSIPSTDSLDLSMLLERQQDSVARPFVEIGREVRIKDYFKFIDSLATKISSDSKLDLNEYLLVHTNPWILDSLKNTDYYLLKAKGVFQYDQRQSVILHRGDRLVIPDSSSIVRINEKLNSTVLDLNIPEYKLRVIQSADTILICKVRVGRPVTEFLDVVGHDVNLRTPVGVGTIIRIERNPDYVNPDDGKRYDSTMRDDGKYTKMPIIPWIEPTINKIRYGDMIHATTNINTLGKPYSHGCVGTSESDAWVIYYNSPIGTKVVFRYDLSIKNKEGETIRLKDIYHLAK